MKTVRFLIISLVLFIGAFVSIAQDEPTIICATDAAQEYQTIIEEQITLMQEGIATGDLQKWLTGVRQLNVALSVVDALCS